MTDSVNIFNIASRFASLKNLQPSQYLKTTINLLLGIALEDSSGFGQVVTKRGQTKPKNALSAPLSV